MAGKVRTTGGAAGGAVFVSLALVMIASFGGLRRASAIEYPVEIIITDETDLFDLYESGEITEEMLESLTNLYRDKIDINRANRNQLFELPGFTLEMADAVLKYRREVGRFNHPTDLAMVPGISRHVLMQALPFAEASPPPPPRPPLLRGQLRAGAVNRKDDDKKPEAYMRPRGTALRYMDVGAVMTYRHIMAPPTFSTEDGYSYYVVDPELSRVTPAGFYTGQMRYGLDHIYAHRDGGNWEAIVGSFKTGYGLRLTIDNSGRARPHGLYSNSDYYENYTSGSVRAGQGFFGGAVRYKSLWVGPGELDATLFVSSASRDAYQYQVRFGDGYCERDADCRDINPFARCDRDARRCYDASVCPAGAAQCEESADRLSNVTLAEIYRENVAGGNVTYRLHERTGLGLTGYVGQYDFSLGAPGMRFANHVRFPPDRSTYGATGLHAFYGWSYYDLDVEATTTDRGTVATAGRLVAEFSRKLQVELFGRYYPTAYDNPYSRSYSDSSQFLGNRSRDEHGYRLRVAARPIRPLQLVGDVDIVNHLHHDTWDLILQGRATYALRHDSFSLQLQMRDNDLSKGGRDKIYGQHIPEEGEEEDLFIGEDEAFLLVPNRRGAGQRRSVSARYTTRRVPMTSLTFFGRYLWEDVRQFDDRFERSYYVWGRAALNLRPGPTVTLRSRFTNNQLNDLVRSDTNNFSYCLEERLDGIRYDVIPARCRGEMSLDSYVDVAQRLGSTVLSGRVGTINYLDNRAYRSTDSEGETIYTKRPSRYFFRAYLTQRF